MNVSFKIEDDRQIDARSGRKEREMLVYPSINDLGFPPDSLSLFHTYRHTSIRSSFCIRIRIHSFLIHLHHIIHFTSYISISLDIHHHVRLLHHDHRRRRRGPPDFLGSGPATIRRPVRLGDIVHVRPGQRGITAAAARGSGAKQRRLHQPRWRRGAGHQAPDWHSSEHASGG
jgi:hypothetical protein